MKEENVQLKIKEYELTKRVQELEGQVQLLDAKQRKFKDQKRNGKKSLDEIEKKFNDLLIKQREQESLLKAKERESGTL